MAQPLSLSLGSPPIKKGANLDYLPAGAYNNHDPEG